MRLKTTATLLLVAAGIACAQVPPPPQAPLNGPAPVMRTGSGGLFQWKRGCGQVSATPLSLSLRDAIQRGLRYNLGVLTNRDVTVR